jgi:hypothetical protein
MEKMVRNGSCECNICGKSKKDFVAINMAVAASNGQISLTMTCWCKDCYEAYVARSPRTLNVHGKLNINVPEFEERPVGNGCGWVD